MPLSYKALIVDDECAIRELIALTLKRMSIEPVTCDSLAAARRHLANEDFALCFTDMRLPDGDGIDLVRALHASHPDLPVAVITAHGSMDTAVTSLKAGAFDFVAKPIQLDILRNMTRTALKLARREPEDHHLIGHSRPIVRLRELIRRVAASDAPAHIFGESGTGKELVARMIHDSSGRAGGPFVPVNCGAIPPDLMESEFFGHRKGAFTGAGADKDGLFQSAHGGTLFLDEIADLPGAMQVKLLRAVQERSVRRIGDTQEARVDCRIISATHQDIDRLAREQRFRQDLYYRINVISITTPPLRTHAEDIPDLAAAILARLSTRAGEPAPALDPAAAAALTAYAFPGNVRELENILQRAVALGSDHRLTQHDLRLPDDSPIDAVTTPPPPPPQLPDESLDAYIERLERKAIQQALTETNQNKTAAAEKLGISFRSLRYKLKKLGIG